MTNTFTNPGHLAVATCGVQSGEYCQKGAAFRGWNSHRLEQIASVRSVDSWWRRDDLVTEDELYFIKS